jgi:serine/threonine protein kinase
VSGDPSSAPIAAGDLLANGRYRVEEVLGEGGMGVVCAATHVALNQKVAVKFLLPEALEHPQAVLRFEREARASASLTSEHVVRVTDVGKLESGAPYFVMEFLEGEDLAQRLRREGPLGVRAALALMSQACEGLMEAHAKGLVHRDIKPSNLFLAKRASGKSVLKVIDFGIAKAELTQESGGHELTRTSEIMGSPQYMSPEQLRDTKNVDARTDLWSLGAAFYECLTGRPPFTGESMTELVVRIATESPPSAALARPDLPAEVVAILERCLTKKLADRYGSAADLLEAVEALRGSTSFRVGGGFPSSPGLEGAAGSGPHLAFDETAGPTSATRNGVPRLLEEVDSTSRAKRSSRAAPIAIGVASLLAIAGVVVFARTSGEVRVNVGAAPPAAAAAPAAAAPAAAPSSVAEAPAASGQTVAAPKPPVADPASPAKVAPELGGPEAKVKAKVAKGKATAARPESEAPTAAPEKPKASETKRKYEPGFE